MWLYVQIWFPLLTVALTAAICFSVASVVYEARKPARIAVGFDVNQNDRRANV